MSRANSDKPRFYVVNRQGMFLAKNPKSGRAHLPCVWTRNRDDAESFTGWQDAAAWGATLPAASQSSARIEDQHGEFWTADRATKAKVMKAPAKKVEKTPDAPAEPASAKAA